jgi:hypothetical protein
MSKVFFIKDYLSSRDDTTSAIQSPTISEQLSLFPEPQLKDSEYYYYVIDIKNETDASLKEFLATTHPVAICEVREVPNFYTGNLNRNKFFEILSNLNIRYIYPDGLNHPTDSGICYLVDNENVDLEWLNRRVIELQDTQQVN